MNSHERSFTQTKDENQSEFMKEQYKRLLHLSEDLILNHQYSDVERILVSAISMCPEQALGYAKLGTFYFQYGDLPKAKDYFEAAARLDPSNLQNWVNLCMYYELMGPIEKAKELAEKVLTLDSENPPALTILGCIYAQEDQPEKALQLLQKATTLDPANDISWYNLSILYQKQNKIQQEIKCLKNAIRIDPFCVMYWCNLGFSYKSLGKFDDCIECFWIAHRNTMYDPSILFEIAVVHALKKEKNLTLEILQLVLSDDFPLREEIMKEKAFNFLRSDEEFQSFLAGIS